MGAPAHSRPPSWHWLLDSAALTTLDHTWLPSLLSPIVAATCLGVHWGPGSSHTVGALVLLTALVLLILEALRDEVAWERGVRGGES